MKFTITGQPERLSTISFDKVLLGTNVIHSLDQRKELKLQKLKVLQLTLQYHMILKLKHTNMVLNYLKDYH
ncbi:hypothetical protein NWE60_01050 [Mycoplasmopsis felis]|nr:hypothetical protein [Mycoplasmopsis felis]WAM01244.1 hypothetical protein NWE60_01050 [Mycoplasmopsis felis]